MKRLVLLVATLAAVAAPAAILPATASAYAPLGPCILRAFTPNTAQSPGYNNMSGYGEVQCNTTRSIAINVCLQQLVTGGWQNVYCTGQSVYEHASYIYGSTYSVWYPVNGRWYRTWDRGWADGTTNTYTSSGVQG